ncbi:MAG TPA: hypothetical protein VKV16_09760 [Solirubrobacteraceae bacterium]|nr:hypothetical protein [Solirubrobacteraceae bacterium]
MGIVVTTTVGLVIWIVLWAFGISGLDSMMVSIVLVLIAVAAHNVALRLSRKDQ